MKIILNKRDLQKYIKNQKNLGFIPTMGAIHIGHLSLVKKSKSLCDKTIVSIFVNKPQFNKKNDFKRYPKNLNRDILMLKKAKVDFLYIPNNKQIYPNGPNKKIKITPFSKKLCGRFRPGHFKAVVDVVNRLNSLIRPKKIFLGKKDFQQIKIIEWFFKKNKINTKIVECKTIRERSGIPLSSRNFLLTLKEKKIASLVYKIIYKLKVKIIKKEILIKEIKKIINKIGVSKIDYIKVLDINNLIVNSRKKKSYKIFVAYYLRSTRLIDNI